jgi:hypothetical protein
MGYSPRATSTHMADGAPAGNPSQYASGTGEFLEDPISQTIPEPRKL